MPFLNWLLTVTKYKITHIVQYKKLYQHSQKVSILDLKKINIKKQNNNNILIPNTSSQKINN